MPASHLKRVRKTRLEEQSTSQYILLPPEGLFPERNHVVEFMTSLPSAVSTERPVRALLRWRSPSTVWEGVDVLSGAEAEDVPYATDETGIPLRVIDTIKEGPALVEMSDDAVRSLRSARHLVRVIPNREYFALADPRDLPLTPPPSGTSSPPVTVQVRGLVSKAPIQGVEVRALTSIKFRLGDDGVTDGNGAVDLRLGATPVQVEELTIEPPPYGHWGAFRGNIGIGSSFTVDLDPIDLSAPGVLGHFYGGAGSNRGQGVRVAVIDMGVDPTHPDLVIARGENTVTGEQAGDFGDNGLGHGTHVAGIVGARGMPPTGVTGLAPEVELLSYRVYGEQKANTETYPVLAAIILAWKAGCHLINLSLGNIPPDDVLRDAIGAANAHGAVVFAAAGNDYGAPVSVPACYAQAVTAMGRKGTYPRGSLEARDESIPTGTDSDNYFAAFSNNGSDVDLVAPGVGIVSTVPHGYAPGRGTSMAAAAATGMAARLLSARPDLLAMTADGRRTTDVLNYLNGTAQRLGLGFNYEGYGML